MVDTQDLYVERLGRATRRAARPTASGSRRGRARGDPRPRPPGARRSRRSWSRATGRSSSRPSGGRGARPPLERTTSRARRRASLLDLMTARLGRGRRPRARPLRRAAAQLRPRRRGRARSATASPAARIPRARRRATAQRPSRAGTPRTSGTTGSRRTSCRALRDPGARAGRQREQPDRRAEIPVPAARRVPERLPGAGASRRCSSERALTRRRTAAGSCSTGSRCRGSSSPGWRASFEPSDELEAQRARAARGLGRRSRARERGRRRRTARSCGALERRGLRRRGRTASSRPRSRARPPGAPPRPCASGTSASSPEGRTWDDVDRARRSPRPSPARAGPVGLATRPPPPGAASARARRVPGLAPLLGRGPLRGRRRRGHGARHGAASGVGGRAP